MSGIDLTLPIYIYNLKPIFIFSLISLLFVHTLREDKSLIVVTLPRK